MTASACHCEGVRERSNPGHHWHTPHTGIALLSMTGIASSVRKRTRKDIARAIIHLRRGGILLYPTETSYAIGCDATNAAAVRAVFHAKGRAAGKSLPLIVASRAMAARYAQWNRLADRLVRAHWPGPLTVVLCVRSGGGASDPPPPHSVGTVLPLPPRQGELEGVRIPMRVGSERGRGGLASGCIARNGTIALRVSSHPVARTLARLLGRPIVSTSANRSGEPSVISARVALQAFGNTRNVFVVDGGTLPRRRPSTIVDATGDVVRVLREGSVHPRRDFGAREEGVSVARG